MTAYEAWDLVIRMWPECGEAFLRNPETVFVDSLGLNYGHALARYLRNHQHGEVGQSPHSSFLLADL
jgi:hypothetical protein